MMLAALRNRVDAVVIAILSVALVAITEWQLLGQYSPTGQVEVAAVVLTGLSVWLAVKNSIWNWPIGIVGVAFYLYLFFDWKLYADAGLQIVYILVGFVGWWAWFNRRQEQRPEAQQASWKHLLAVAGAIAVGTLVAREYLIEVGGAAPFWDALLTSGSLGAQYLLIRKYIENWYLWAVLDAAYVILFINRGYYLTAALYAVFFVIVIKAAFEWRQYLPKVCPDCEGTTADEDPGVPARDGGFSLCVNPIHD